MINDLLVLLKESFPNPKSYCVILSVKALLLLLLPLDLIGSRNELLCMGCVCWLGGGGDVVKVCFICGTVFNSPTLHLTLRFLNICHY